MSPKYKAEKIVPYNEQESKTVQIERMFDSIAHTYDQLNIAFTLGIDRFWRRWALETLRAYAPQQMLDVATGTADLAILAGRRLKPQKLIGIDLSEGMLAVGREKVKRAGLEPVVELTCADCLQLPFADASFDAITVAFGVRNFENLEKGFAEMFRVLKPGGVLLVLELSTPTYFPVKQLYQFYASTVIPFMGRLVSKDQSAYAYLNKSVKVVPQGKEMEMIFRKAGFRQTRFRRYTFGVCTNYLGVK